MAWFASVTLPVYHELVNAMRLKQLFTIAGLLFAGAAAHAQSSYPYPQVVPGGGSQPGTTQPILERLPLALPRVGTPIGVRPGSLTRPLQTSGEGSMTTMNGLISPFPGQPMPQPTFWQNLERRWFGMFEVDTNPGDQSVYVPGISRRNRERHDERMQRRR